jgi:hypothetical protein
MAVWHSTQLTDSPEDTRKTWSGPILEEHEGYCTVRDLETGIFGSGADPEAAQTDFERALREHRDLLERQDDLSPELAVQLAYIRELLA